MAGGPSAGCPQSAQMRIGGDGEWGRGSAGSGQSERLKQTSSLRTRPVEILFAWGSSCVVVIPSRNERYSSTEATANGKSSAFNAAPLSQGLASSDLGFSR